MRYNKINLNSIHFWATGIVPPNNTLSIPCPSWIFIMDAERLLPKFGLNSEMIPFSADTSTIVQTPKWPWSHVYYATSYASMFQIPATPTLCSSVLTQPPHAVTSVRQDSLQVCMHYYCLDFPSTSKYCKWCPSVPMPNLCTIDLTDFSSNFWFREALEFHFNGFHREASSVFWFIPQF